MRILARASSLLALLFVVAVPAAQAGPLDLLGKFKSDVQTSFGLTAYNPALGLQAQTAVTAPALQMNTARQCLEEARVAARAAAETLPRVSISGNGLQASSRCGAFGEGEGKGSPPTGGGASADQPDPFERWGLFIHGDFNVARQNAVGTQLGFKSHTNGATIGADYRFLGNNVLGASVTFLKSSTDLDTGAGSQDAKGYGLVFFGSYVPTTNAYMDAMVNIGHNSYDTLRQSGPISFSGRTSGNQWGFSISGGYGFNSGPLTVAPYGRVEYIDARVNDYTETGNGGATETIGDQRIKVTTLSLGTQASYAIGAPWGVLVPNGRIEYQRLANSSRNDIIVGSGSTPVPVSALGPDRNYGTFAVSAVAVMSGGFQAFFNYQQLFGKSDVRDQLYTVGVRVNF